MLCELTDRVLRLAKKIVLAIPMGNSIFPQVAPNKFWCFCLGFLIVCEVFGMQR